MRLAQGYLWKGNNGNNLNVHQEGIGPRNVGPAHIMEGGGCTCTDTMSMTHSAKNKASDRMLPSK